MAQVTNTQWLKDGLGGGQDSEGIITHAESVIITFDSLVSTTKEAIDHGGFRAGQRHRLDDNLILQPNIDADVHEDDNAKVWIFNLTYSTNGFNESSLEDDTYTPEVDFGKWTYNRVVTVDKETGDIIKLPTGELYDPQFVEQVSSVIMSITVKEYSANIDRISLIGSINDTEIRIAGVLCPKYCAMLDDYKPKPFVDEKGYLTFRNTFDIKLKFFKNVSGEEIGFKLETVASSFNQLVGGELEEITVKDKDGEEVPVATPQLVDQNGAKTTTPYNQEWVVHDLTSFRAFGLPTSYPVS